MEHSKLVRMVTLAAKVVLWGRGVAVHRLMLYAVKIKFIAAHLVYTATLANALLAFLIVRMSFLILWKMSQMLFVPEKNSNALIKRPVVLWSEDNGGVARWKMRLAVWIVFIVAQLGTIVSKAVCVAKQIPLLRPLRSSTDFGFELRIKI